MTNAHQLYQDKEYDTEYNPRPPRPTHAYRFHVGILGVNRLINGEATKVLYEQNMFIELTSDLPYEHNLYWLGAPIIAHGATKPRFNTCVLQIALKCKRNRRNNSKSPMQVCSNVLSLDCFSV